MGKKKKLTPSEENGVEYRRAKTWQIALSQLNGGAGMAFYILMGMASYIANAGYGIAVAVTGIILTGTRVLDGITDPIIAVVFDKMNTRFGKLRIGLFTGWLLEALAVLMMFVWGSSGKLGIIFFVFTYVIYIIGYTINGVAGNVIGPVMVNDPKQRPVINVWGTAYAYFFPMVFSMVITVGILPRYGNQYTVPMLGASCIFIVVVSFILEVLTCIGVSYVDKPENFEGISTKKTDKVTLKDMANLLKGNRPLQMFIVSAASDKLAQQIGSQAVVATLLFGILIGNMQISSIITVVAMLPSLLFAIVGAKHAGKVGNKEAMVIWTKVCIVITAISILFCTVVDMRQITVALIPTVIFFLLTLALNGAKMCVSTATSSMRADVIDYELDRSGKYLPAAVSATYSFIDKVVSAISSTIAAGSVALIGYKTVMPQPTDSPTTAIFVLSMVLYYVFPVVGWICTLVAMKWYKLSKQEMVEVQKRIQEKKQEAA